MPHEWRFSDFDSCVVFIVLSVFTSTIITDFQEKREDEPVNLFVLLLKSGGGGGGEGRTL
jgi:hypothetical protein